MKPFLLLISFLTGIFFSLVLFSILIILFAVAVGVIMVIALSHVLEQFSFGWDQVSTVGKPAANIFRANGE